MKTQKIIVNHFRNVSNEKLLNNMCNFISTVSQDCDISYDEIINFLYDYSEYYFKLRGLDINTMQVDITSAYSNKLNFGRHEVQAYFERDLFSNKWKICLDRSLFNFKHSKGYTFACIISDLTHELSHIYQDVKKKSMVKKWRNHEYNFYNKYYKAVDENKYKKICPLIKRMLDIDLSIQEVEIDADKNSFRYCFLILDDICDNFIETDEELDFIEIAKMNLRNEKNWLINRDKKAIETRQALEAKIQKIVHQKSAN